MVEPKVSNYYKVATLLFQEGIPLTNKELNNLIKEYNNWEMPISKRLENILENNEKFIKFIKDRKKDIKI